VSGLQVRDGGRQPIAERSMSDRSADTEAWALRAEVLSHVTGWAVSHDAARRSDARDNQAS
jgi:hypothetical protein